MRKRIGILMSLLLLLSACGSKNALEGEPLRVGMECGYAPYNWTLANPTETSEPIAGGQYCDGYDVQIAKIIANEMGRPLVIEKTTWESLILSLQNGQIDAVIAGMSPTPDRKKEIGFSNPYFVDDATAFGVVVKRDGPYAGAKSVSDFESAVISAQMGTHHVQLLTQLQNIKPFENLKDFPTLTIFLQSGELDGFVADSGTGQMINAANPDLMYIQLDGDDGFVVTEEMAGVAVGVNKDNQQLIEEINAALETIPTHKQQALMDQAINANEVSTGNFFEKVGSILQNNGSLFLRGTLTTLFISFVGTLLGFLIGLFVAMTRDTKITRPLAHIYITVFRGTPMMVQAMLFYHGIALLFNGFRWSDIPYSNFVIAIIIVSINTGAYMAETIRGGIQAIDKGQFEAAQGLGFSRFETMRHIILPQAVRNVIPALGNEFIVNIKDTSVLNIVSITELFFISNGIASTTYQILETFTITAMIYLVLTTIFTFILRWVERKMSKSESSYTSIPTSMTTPVNITKG